MSEWMCNLLDKQKVNRKKHKTDEINDKKWTASVAHFICIVAAETGSWVFLPIHRSRPIQIVSKAGERAGKQTSNIYAQKDNKQW